jgi:hypothetical protein
MSNATRSPRPVKPVGGTARWLRNNLGKPDGQSVLEINGRSYWLTVLRDGERVVGFRLEKFGGGTTYDVNAETWECSCPDATYRERQCKHSKALQAALWAAGQL